MQLFACSRACPPASDKLLTLVAAQTLQLKDRASAATKLRDRAITRELIESDRLVRRTLLRRNAYLAYVVIFAQLQLARNLKLDQVAAVGLTWEAPNLKP